MGIATLIGTGVGYYYGGAAGGSLGASLGSQVDASLEQNRANEYNSAEAISATNRSRDMAREQMAFQERMSNTAYQRATQDMINAGINPMLAYRMGGASAPGGASGSSPSASYTPAGAALLASESSSIQANTASRVADAQIKTEGFRAAVVQNEAIKGNYALMQLAAELDAAMRVTGKLGSDALSALAEPRVRAGLQELRAALASASNDADVYEALNSKGVQIALDILGRVTGSGSAIAGAVDRYRARSQRGDIINLNQE